MELLSIMLIVALMVGISLIIHKLQENSQGLSSAPLCSVTGTTQALLMEQTKHSTTNLQKNLDYRTVSKVRIRCFG